MSQPIRVCLYNPDSQMPLHAFFAEIKDIIVVGQVSNWTELKDWIRHANVNVVVVNLDDENGLDIIERITMTAPACGVIGVSRNTDPTAIIRAMRVGCAQFVPWPADVQDLRAALDRMRTSRTITLRDSKRICVVGSSGGAGATTIACNLAMELAHLINHRCALIDMNLELGDVGCVFDCRPKFSVADLCREGVEIDSTMLSKAFHELPCNVSLLVRPERLEDAHEVTPEGVVNLLSVAHELFPFVVVDLPRSSSFLSAAALKDTDRVLIVTQLGVPFIRNATRIYQCLCQMGAPEESIEIVLNRCKADFAHITPDNVEAHFGKPVFGMIPNDYQRVQSSLDFGRPIMSGAPNSPARLAIHEMARKIASEELPDGQPAAPSRGFLNRFWRRTPQTTEVSGG